MKNANLGDYPRACFRFRSVPASTRRPPASVKVIVAGSGTASVGLTMKLAEYVACTEPPPLMVASNCCRFWLVNCVLNVPSNVLISPVELLTTKPSVLNDTTELVGDTFVRLKGDPGGVQFWPDAGAARQSARPKTPAGKDCKVKLMLGLAVKTIQSVNVKGVPTGWSTRFRSLIVPLVPAKGENEPV